MILTLHPSNYENYVYVGFHISVGVALALHGGPWALLITTFMLLALHFWWGWPKRLTVISHIQYQDEVLSLCIGGQWQPCKLSHHACWQDRLVRLDFANGWMRRSVSLWPDAMSAKDHRRLRVLLKHAIDMSV